MANQCGGLTAAVRIAAATGFDATVPPPLNPDGVTYADGTGATVDQMARDVTTFLAWASEPEMEVRKRLKSLGPVLIPREFVFMDRAAIGLGAAFLHLRAELNFGQMFAESVEGFSPESLAERQSKALALVGL